MGDKFITPYAECVGMGQATHTDGGDESATQLAYDTGRIADAIRAVLAAERLTTAIRHARESTIAHAGGDPYRDAVVQDMEHARTQLYDVVRKLDRIAAVLNDSGDLDEYERTGRQ